VEVLIRGDSDEAGLWGEVALEIRCDAWLSEVKALRTDTGLQLTGKVVGAVPAPLELYTRVDEQHADYRTIQPTAEGQPFQIDLPGVVSENPLIQVELVHVSRIWYTAELTCFT